MVIDPHPVHGEFCRKYVVDFKFRNDLFGSDHVAQKITLAQNLFPAHTCETGTKTSDPTPTHEVDGEFVV